MFVSVISLSGIAHGKLLNIQEMIDEGKKKKREGVRKRKLDLLSSLYHRAKSRWINSVLTTVLRECYPHFIHRKNKSEVQKLADSSNIYLALESGISY